MKHKSSRAFLVYGPDSALDSEIAAEVLSDARIDCAYHRSLSCDIKYREEVDLSNFPNILTKGSFNCSSSGVCERIVRSAVENAESFLMEAFEGTDVKVSIKGHL